MLRATQASARKRALLGPNAKLSVGTENRSSLKELEKKPKVAWGSRAQLEVKAKSVVSKPPAVPQLASKQKQQQQQTVEQGILKRASLSSSSLVQQKHSLDRFHITASSEEPYHKLTVLERVVKPDVVQAAAIPHGNIKDKNTKPSKSNSRKKEKVRKALHALSIENARLKSQLTLLRSGITSVSHVLQENPCVAIQQNPLSDHQEEDSTTPQRSLLPSLSQLEAWSLPPLRPDQQGADDTRIDGTAETHASSLSRLILTMESSLDGFQAMLERLEDKEARRRKKRLARSLAAAASLGAQE